jgi:hypothetical protein
MSGAGRIKQDGSDDTTTYEVKDALKQFVLKEKEVRDAFVNAARNGKASVWLIVFPEFEVELHVRKR